MMGRLRFFGTLQFVLVILIAAFLLTGRAEAILAPDYDFSSAIVKADLIVKGKVIETRSEWVDSPNGKNIFTYVRIRVDRVLKGNLIGEDVEFRVMGGTVGDITETVSDFATFHPTEEAIVLLGSEQGVSGILDVLPGYGKVSIRKGKVSWSGSVMPVDEFVEGLNAFIKYPDSDLNQLLRLDQNQITTSDQKDTEVTEVVDVGQSEPSLKGEETADQDDTEVIGR